MKSKKIYINLKKFLIPLAIVGSFFITGSDKEVHADAVVNVDSSVVIPIVDTILPEVKNVKVTYTKKAKNDATHDFVTWGDTVTMTFDVSEPLEVWKTGRPKLSMDFLFGSPTDFAQTGPLSYKATYTFTNQYLAYEGWLNLLISNPYDLAGNTVPNGYLNSQIADSSVNTRYYNPPSVTVDNASTDINVNKYPGNRIFTISGKVWQTLGEGATVSVTVGPQTKTVVLPSLPTSSPATSNFSVSWDVVKDKLPVGDYTPKVVVTSWYPTVTATNTGKVLFPEVYLWDKYNSVQSGSTWVKGSTLIQKNVVGYLGQYPDNGRHTDGYWYVSKGIYVPEPDLTLDAGTTAYYSNNPGRNIISITGKVEDSAGDDVTVSATLNGKTKSVVISGTTGGSPKPFTLSWNVGTDNLAEGTYQNIEVSAANPTAAQKKTSTMVAIVDTTKPTLSNMSLVSNNADPKYAKTGDQITLNFKLSEVAVSPPTVLFTGLSNPVSVSGSPAINFVATRTMVDTHPEGFITVSVSYEDLAGNKNSDMFSTNTVTFYSSAPISQTVVMSSNSSTNTSYAKIGDTVTLNVVSNHNWKYLPVVKLAGIPVSSTVSEPTVITSSLPVTSSVPEGQVSVLVSGILDAAGNVGPNATNVTNGTKVTVDNTSPAFSSVTINTVPAGKSTVNIGETVKLTVISYEPLSNVPKITIEGNAVTVTPKSPTTYETSYVIKPSDLEGKIDFEIKDYIDKAGNTGPITTTTTDGSSVSIAYSSPVIQSSKIYSSNSNKAVAVEGDTVTVEFTSSLPIKSGFTAMINGDSASVSNVSGNTWRVTKKLWAGDPEGLVSFSISDITGTSGKSVSDISSTTDSSKVSFTRSTMNFSTVRMVSSNSNNRYAKVGDTVTVTLVSTKDMRDNPIVRVGSGVAALSSGSTLRNKTYTYVMQSGDPEGVLSLLVSNIYDLGGTVYSSVSTTTDGTSVTFDKTAPRVESFVVSGQLSPQKGVYVQFSLSELSSTTPTIIVDGRSVTATATSSLSYKTFIPYDSSWDGNRVFATVGNVRDLAGNSAITMSSPIPVLDGDTTIDIVFSGAENGGTYSSVVIPVFYASSTLSQSTSIIEAKLDGQDWISGKPVTTKGTHTLRVKAKNELTSMESTIVFYVN